MAVAFGKDLVADGRADRGVGHLAGAARDGEAVVLPGRRARLAVQGEAAVPAQILPFGSGDDQHVQPGRADHRAHRVHAGTAVGPNGGQEGQADPVLVELLAAGGRQSGLLAPEFRPRDHAAEH